MKSIAVMQPYFLPYIGYFQLLAAVDKFVVFDDVNFINRGWINRNRILVGGQPHLITLPIQSASQNRLICELQLVTDSPWREKLLKTFVQAYRRAPHFEDVAPILEQVIFFESNSLDAFLLNSITRVAEFLGINTEICGTSRIYQNAPLKGQSRILDICRAEAASIYINAIGGTDLYEQRAFSEVGISLRFLKPNPLMYSQSCEPFVEKLSIVDLMMFAGRASAQSQLNEFQLVS